MTSKLTSTLFALALLASPALVRAEEPARTPAPSTPETKPTDAAPTTVYAKRTVMDFTECVVTGELVRPAGSYVSVPRRARFRSLIRTRGDFRGELEVSTERL